MGRMLTSKDRWFNHAAIVVKVVLAMLVVSLVVSSCSGAEPMDSDTSTTQAVGASWSTEDFEALVEYCDKVFGEPSSSGPVGDEIGPIEVECSLVVRQNRDELGCPVEGTYEVLEETARLIRLDIQFDKEQHSVLEVDDWSFRMQSELDEVYERVGCRESLILNW